MKQLKAKRLITIDGGRVSSYSAPDMHQRALVVARKLEEAGFAWLVQNTELPARIDKPEEDRVRYDDCTYYVTNEPRLVEEDEYQAILKCGATGVKVVGIYQDEVTKWHEVAYWIGAVTFAVWNVVLVSKVAGLL